MEKKDLEAIAEVILEKDILVMSDEIYSELSYKGDHVSIVTIPGMLERTILINGFSKAYAIAPFSPYVGGFFFFFNPFPAFLYNEHCSMVHSHENFNNSPAFETIFFWDFCKYVPGDFLYCSAFGACVHLAGKDKCRECKTTIRTVGNQ